MEIWNVRKQNILIETKKTYFYRVLACTLTTHIVKPSEFSQNHHGVGIVNFLNQWKISSKFHFILWNFTLANSLLIKTILMKFLALILIIPTCLDFDITCMVIKTFQNVYLPNALKCLFKFNSHWDINGILSFLHLSWIPLLWRTCRTPLRKLHIFFLKLERNTRGALKNIKRCRQVL